MSHPLINPDLPSDNEEDIESGRDSIEVIEYGILPDDATLIDVIKKHLSYDLRIAPVALVMPAAFFLPPFYLDKTMSRYNGSRLPYDIALKQISNGWFTPVQTLVNYASEHNHPHRVGAVFRNGLLTTLPLMSLIAGLPFLARFIQEQTGQSDDVIDATFEFFLKAMPGFMFNTISDVEMKTLLGLKDAGFASLFQMLQTGLFLGFSYGMVTGSIGFSKLGFTGVSLAITYANAITLAAQTAFLGLNKKYAEYELFSFRKHSFDIRVFRRLAIKGLPLAIQGALETSFDITLATVLARHDDAALIGIESAMQYNLFVTLPSICWHIATGIMTNSEVRRQNAHNTILISKFSLTTMALLTSALASCFIVFSDYFLRSDLDEEYDLVRFMFAISIVNEVINGLKIGSSAILNSYLDTTFPMIISGSFNFGLNTILVLLADHFEYSLQTIFSAQLIGTSLTTVCELLRLGYRNQQAVQGHYPDLAPEIDELQDVDSTYDDALDSDYVQIPVDDSTPNDGSVLSRLYDCFRRCRRRPADDSYPPAEYSPGAESAYRPR